MTEHLPKQHARPQQALQEVVGYLNFSAGAEDGKFLKNVSLIYSQIESADPDADPVLVLGQWLRERMDQLQPEGGAFSDLSQARVVADLLEHHFRPAYRQFHQDLLWSRKPRELWRPFFWGRVAEAILAQGPPWDETHRIVAGARDSLDDYIGYRPLPVLETEQRIEPYRHEWVRPIPLYIESAGVASGEYQQLIEITLGILRHADPDLLRDAWFDIDLLQELALDPRAYDFDHPAGKRPNYHFGQWDPNFIDNRGFYRRFVVQPIALDALLARVDDAAGARAGGSFTRDELLFEAGAVLAGTMLMASGTCGDGPGRHNSEVTLATLLPHIAGYRDRFYQQLLADAKGPHGERLRAEAKRLRQPLAGARQHLNQELARRRADQMQRVRLAQLYARMGYTEAAQRQARAVRVASARMLAQIYCRLTEGHRALDGHKLDVVAARLPEIEDLLHRGIECGALVDPWSVVGFGGAFSLFPAIENSVHDYRVDELVRLVEQLLDLCARAWTEAAAIDDDAHEKTFSAALARVSDWWDRYATSTVSGVPRLVAKEIEISSNLVAGALNAWHKAGAAAGDIGFWRMFVDQFDSPKAFQLVIEALLDKGDLVASMALAMQWLSQVDFTPLEDGDASFDALAQRWLQMVDARERETHEPMWPTVEKFFAHLEASADEYWQVPAFELGETVWSEDDEALDDLLEDDADDDFDDAFEGDSDLEFLSQEDFDPHDDQFENDEDDELDNLFGAAYEGVTYEDSTDDGMDSSIFDAGQDDTRLAFEAESDRLEQRLGFIRTTAALWKQTAISWGTFDAAHSDASERRAAFEGWQHQATRHYTQLCRLLDAVHAHRLAPPRGGNEELIEYDRRRVLRDGILEQVIVTCVELSDAGRLLRAASGSQPEAESTSSLGRTIEVLRGVLTGDDALIRKHWPEFCASLLAEELLYIPLSKGGDPRRIVKARALHQLIHDLLGWLPRLGLVRETCQLLDVAQRMEIDHPVGPGAVTEYDRLFENGYEAVVRCLVASADSWDDGAAPAELAARPDARASDSLLVQALQDLTESQLGRWLRHSRTVRLSVVEKLSDPETWRRFVEFIERYGGDLFDQSFLTLGNLRGILHRTADVWLTGLLEEEDTSFRLLDDLQAGKVDHEIAAQWLTIAIEAVVENYREYRDYNTTTTQSDHGELLYVLIDFLRLRTSYDRVAWNLKPVYLAHRILVRSGRLAAAELWRAAVEQRTAGEADARLGELESLSQHYGMRLPTVAERLAERFVRPLTIDRLQALVEPAITAAAAGADETSAQFVEVAAEIDNLSVQPSGAGLDAPDWIGALENEITETRVRLRHPGQGEDALAHTPQRELTWPQIQQQLSESTPLLPGRPGDRKKK
ncbi:hypothetical protein Pla175_00240 [Pirellulimonas nuda]|uniref:Uncharacterized protein n=1 Tax=Pirellulimonas nuda TaxID=2528009 RepID=A0A518D5C7_9BACT|nr:hypothetical protein [Pirellulimonas nuda]QDU86674.1 hypothetical protein Pla175_00240 [Pirellulimonas nuda]